MIRDKSPLTKCVKSYLASGKPLEKIQKFLYYN